MSIRSKLVATLALLLVAAMGTTGTVLIAQQARHDRALIDEKQLLLVENAAFSVQENLQVAARELLRLSKLPEVDPADNNLDPERELLYGAHQNSVFFKEVRVVDADGKVSLVQPEGAGAVGQDFASRAWFADARKADQPFFYTAPEHAARAEAIAVIVPLRAQGRFMGAIQGILDLASDRMLTPALRHAAGPTGEFAVIDRDGRVLLPSGLDLDGAAGWRPAFHDLSLGRSGTLLPRNSEHLYAFAPVGIGTWGVAMRWPWRALNADAEHQVETTGLLLALGIIAAGLLGALFASYLSRPLVELGDIARRIARGEPGGARPSKRRDEVGALSNAFHQMETELRSRDEKIREDMETISLLNASLEERVVARTRELSEAQARLVDVERFAAMGKTAAAIAHELKNALNGLGMCVDLVLADTPPNPGTLRVRAQMHREIARLRDVTESLLTFSRAPRLELGSHDLNQIVAQALEVLSEQIADGGVAVETDLLDGALTVSCDGYKLQGVLINLAKNAVEAMATYPLDLAADGPPRTPCERKLTVRTRREGGVAIVEVADTGPGMSAEARRHLWEPFFTTKVTGTGLGLATARRVVDAHGGRLEADDRGDGACFRVTLLAPEAAVAAS